MPSLRTTAEYGSVGLHYFNVYPRLRFLASNVSNANPAESLLSKNSRRCRPVEPIRPQRRTNVFRAKRVRAEVFAVPPKKSSPTSRGAFR